MGRQGVGAAAGVGRGERGLGGVPRRRHTPVAGAARLARRADGRRRPRRAHRRRALRLPDRRAALAAPGAADHARLPRRAARRQPIPGRCTGGWATVSASPPGAACWSTPAAGGPSPTTRVEDVALVRAMATAGFSVAFLDAADLLTVRMYESATEAWTRVGALAVAAGRRALAAANRRARHRRPSPRPHRCCGCSPAAATCSTWRCSPSASARSPGRRARTSAGALAYWLSPTADLAAVAAIARSLLMPTHRWRGRSYPATPSRSASR